MVLKRMVALILVGLFIVSSFAGCGSKPLATTPGTSSTTTTPGTSSGAQETSSGTSDAKVVDIEIWYPNDSGNLPVEKDSPLYKFYVEKTGVGITMPYVEWNGGKTYLDQLNLRIASGDMPDMFLPYNGVEVELAKNGAILDLTDLLPEKAPNLWNVIPQAQWNIARTFDPNGKDRIYLVPGLLDYTLMGGLIRQDWLDKLGLPMPKTTDDFINVLKAFRDKDPNGNRQKDEIPTGGREEARWMDHLFAPFGVAMWEGNPDWDIYDGELTYSGITQNMKDALAFCAKLYKEGLMDPETLLNKKADWDAKIDGGKVGLYYHWAESTYKRSESIAEATGNKPNITVLPVLTAPGYEGKGFITKKSYRDPIFVVKNQKDQAKVDACLKVMNAYGDKNLWMDFYMGVEGMHFKAENGKKVRLPEDKTTQQAMVLSPQNAINTMDVKKQLLESIKTPEREWSLNQSLKNMDDNNQNGRLIAGDGMPPSVYNGYPDIQGRKLYVEYASKIIMGEYPINKFDEFVQKWKQTGGDEVTKRAREWYSKLKK